MAKRPRKKAAKKKATLRDETIVESPLMRKAVSKGSLEIKEGCPPDQVLGTRATKEPIEDHNDDLRTGNQGPRGAIEQVQASKWSSQGGHPCHQTDRSTINADLRTGY